VNIFSDISILDLTRAEEPFVIPFSSPSGGGGISRPDESTAASVPRGDQIPGAEIGRGDEGVSGAIGRVANQE
jgi:hypothetical protein